MFKYRLWSDHWPSYGYLFLMMAISILVYFLPKLFIEIISSSTLKLSESLGILILTIFFAYFCLITLTPRLSKIVNNGIYLATAKTGFHIEDRPHFNTRKFISFNEIKKIEIISKKVDRRYFMDKDLFLRVYKNSGKIEECYINNAKGFILALKKIGKNKLLKKEDIPERLEVSLKRDWKLLLEITISIAIVMLLIMLLKRRLL